MIRKIIISIIIFSSVLLMSGCSLKEEAEYVSATEIEEDISLVEEEEEVTTQEMKVFFAKFLNVDHETMLVLNQKPKEVNDEYWRVHTAYKEKSNEILGDYLSRDAKEKLEKQYLHDDFHFPRFIELNDYMITGISSVSDARITSKQIKEESTVYEVEVIAMANVIDLDWGMKKYIWNDKKGYYVQDIFLETGIYVADEPGLDKIRVGMNYFVEVPDGETFTVSSVREKTGLYLGMDEQGHIKNNHFVTRRSFLNAVIIKEEGVIHRFIEAFMKQDYSFYNYYRKAHDTDYATFKSVLEKDLKLMGMVVLEEDDYKVQFEPSIIPLKDNMESLYFDVMQDVDITPHVSSSARLSTYQVVINANVTLINGQVIPYEYTYLMILDKEQRISSVRLLTQRECDPVLDLEGGEL